MNENAQYYKEQAQWYLEMARGWWAQLQRDRECLFVLDQWRWCMDGAGWNYKRYQHWLRNDL